MRLVARGVALVFSLLLLLVGALALLTPDPRAATSQAPAYAVFHLLGGLGGLASVLGRKGRASTWFLLIFGVLDLYQAAASLADWFPKAYFGWTPADDQLHLALGALLVFGGAFLLLLSRRRP